MRADIVVVGCQYTDPQARPGEADEFKRLEAAIGEFCVLLDFDMNQAPIVTRDGAGYRMMMFGSSDSMSDALKLKAHLVRIMEGHGLHVMEEVNAPLPGFDQTPEPLRRSIEGKSTHWRCPKCKAVYQKKRESVFSEFVLRMGGHVGGTAKCGQCGTVHAAADVYGGKYDVEPDQP